jgi:pantoate--beta-alanine ligase
MTSIVTSPLKMQSTTLRWIREDCSIGFVPTMGCLHEGHLSLIREAKKRSDKVVVSIFVNPLQFGKNEDLSTYPRPFERDVELCREAGIDVIFHPSAKELYPRGFQTSINGGELTKMYCGKTRPIHFNGMLTVVSMLFDIVNPTFAFFGEKDFQQLFLIKQMCRDFHKPVEIVGMPIVREASGLAMSSRNTYLSEVQREQATCLYRAIERVKNEVKKGNPNTRDLIATARNLVAQTPGMQVDYVHLVSGKTLLPFGDRAIGPARLLLAAFIGQTPKVRLIDNAAIPF